MLHIDSGLFPHMVLQRNNKNVSDTPIAGRTTLTGTVEVTVSAAKKTLPGWANKRLGKSAQGLFKAQLTGIPVGGPYHIQVRITDAKTAAVETAQVPDVLVGDVWVAAGQSNMQGCGLLTGRAKPHPMARAFYMHDMWGVAEDPIHNLWDCVDQVHVDLNSGARHVNNHITGAGPAVSFAQRMHALTQVPQGLIACAHGGTSMAQWDPAKKADGSKSLYGATLRRVAKNGGKIAGIIWYQGESDCFPDLTKIYTPGMKKLIGAFRKDFKDKNLPFILVQLSRVVASWDGGHWNSIREQQRLLPKVIKNVAVVPAIDLSIDDGIHISGKHNILLGNRLAEATHTLRGGKKAQKPPIELTKVHVEGDPGRGYARVIAEFANVEGELTALGERALGFGLVDGQGNPAVYHTEVVGNKAVIHTTVGPADATDRVLYYGHGPDPICTVTDAAGRSLPAFGPLPVGPARAITPFVRKPYVSKPQPSAGKLHELAYPADQSGFGYAQRTTGENFANLHPELMNLPDVTVFYRIPVECAEPMKLRLLLGYDGPVKVWLDKKEIFFDPKGTNPAIADAKSIDFKGLEGTHELMIALGSNDGRAWGVFVRLQRLDVSAAELKKGLGVGKFVLPKVPA